MPVQGIVLGLKACRIPDPAVPVLLLIPFSSLVIMADCRYCNKPSSDGDVDGIHKACQDEFNRRQAAGMCAYCDENKGFHDHGIACKGCWKNLNFRGYPGP